MTDLAEAERRGIRMAINWACKRCAAGKRVYSNSGGPWTHEQRNPVTRLFNCDAQRIHDGLARIEMEGR